MPDVTTLYDEDFVLWSEQQADALRAAARGSSNQPIDWFPPEPSRQASGE